MKTNLLFAAILLSVLQFCLPVNSRAQTNEVATIGFDDFLPLLSKTNDTLYVINFWATWCAPCVEELPHFEVANKHYKNRKLKILLVSLDFKGAKDSRLLPFLQKHDIQCEVLHLYEPDANQWISRVDSTWTGAIPATLFYRNTQRLFTEGSLTSQSLNQYINSFLNP
ncbi:MAG TPA: TlpA disulfide reductase family protein [Bacteroidales bacterium]|nr:TlpA disulfide reductase family protein [Bacteroidales bacterium]